MFMLRASALRTAPAVRAGAGYSTPQHRGKLPTILVDEVRKSQLKAVFSLLLNFNILALKMPLRLLPPGEVTIDGSDGSFFS